MRPERIIRAGRVVANEWSFVGVDAGEAADASMPAGPVVVPLARWLAARDTLRNHPAPVGVWLKPDDDPLQLADDVATLPVIAVQFPKFTDGRGYSTAYLLRSRLRFAGELLAFGDVGRDQLFLLHRVGFDAFSLAPHRDLDAALGGLGDFSVRYQASVDEPQPLFRRRLAGAAR